MRVANALLESLHAKYADLSVDTIDLFTGDLPAVAGDNIETKYTLMARQPIYKRHKESWTKIELLIEHFLSADIYLISTPMWNFSIPYALKYYIDSIIQPGYLYKYNEHGQAVGLVHGKRLICVTSRGGDYSEKGPFHAYDFQEPDPAGDFWLCRNYRHAFHQCSADGCDAATARSRCRRRD